MENCIMPPAGNSSNDLVVNWHLTEACNFGCKFCYAHWSKDYKVDIWRSEEATDCLLQELFQLKDIAGGKWSGIRLNLAGGEPFLNPKRTCCILRSAKEIGFKLSTITNGSMLTPSLVRTIAPMMEILGISMDSAVMETNRKIGRCSKKNEESQITPENIARIFSVAREANPSIECKLNTVVNAYNWQEDLSPAIALINPDRWKIFQVLPVAESQEIARLQKPLLIREEQFKSFLRRHRKKFSNIMRPENNREMTESYIMVNPNGRFYQNRPEGTAYTHSYSSPITEVGCKEAWQQISFERKKFDARYY